MNDSIYGVTANQFAQGMLENQEYDGGASTGKPGDTLPASFRTVGPPYA